MSDLFLRLVTAKDAIEKGESLRVFVPADDDTWERAQKKKLGQVFRGKFKLSRNYEHHKKYFALLNQVFDMQELYESVDEFRRAVLIESGQFVLVKNMDGTVGKEAKSIAFDNMGQDEFEKVYTDTITVLVRFSPQLCPASPQAFASAVIDFS